jgi:hypothetical protein
MQNGIVEKHFSYVWANILKISNTYRGYGTGKIATLSNTGV